jgi:tellurium resistance protein TerD
MSVKLTKGQTVNLKKPSGNNEYDLSSITIGLGWDVRDEKRGFLNHLLGSNNSDFDLDAILFLLNNQGKVERLTNQFFGSDVIFFNNISFPNGTGTSNDVYGSLSKNEIQRKVTQILNMGEIVVHTGDNLTGEGDGDDEQIIVQLDKLPPRIDKLVFIVSIYKGIEKNQHFGLVDNAFIRAVDARGIEIAKYLISDDPSFNKMCSLVFAEIYRKNGEWKFRAIGQPERTDSFVDILERYVG